MSTHDYLKLSKGFLMHKMYWLGYVGAKHTSVDNLPKSCPVELRNWVDRASNELLREGLLVPKPTSHGQHIFAVASPQGYDYANSYERHAGLPLMVYGKPQRNKRALPLSKEELHKLKIR